MNESAESPRLSELSVVVWLARSLGSFRVERVLSKAEKPSTRSVPRMALGWLALGFVLLRSAYLTALAGAPADTPSDER